MTEITRAFIALIDAGWSVDLCSCTCGGRLVWSRPRPGGASEVHGCVCHADPVELLSKLRDETCGSACEGSK